MNFQSLKIFQIEDKKGKKMSQDELQKFKEFIDEKEYENLIRLKKLYPFFSFFIFSDEFYYGVLQKSNKDFISVYVLKFIKNKEEKMLFVKLSEDWWWESNRKFPINFFHPTWDRYFKKYLRSFSWNGIKCYTGPLLIIDNQSKTKCKIIEL